MRSLKESRAASFAAVTAVYIIAAGVGVAVYRSLSLDWYLSLLAAGAFANTVLFLAVSIPMADGRQSRKEGFDAYKKHTRMLLPIKK